MNNEEIQSLIKQLKASGLDDDKIMNVFFESFKEGEMDREDLETLAKAMGKKLTDEFKNDPEPDPISVPEEDEKVDLENAKENPEEELGKDPEDSSEEDSSEEEEDEEKDWEKAQKMFKI